MTLAPRGQSPSVQRDFRQALFNVLRHLPCASRTRVPAIRPLETTIDGLETGAASCHDVFGHAVLPGGAGYHASLLHHLGTRRIDLAVPARIGRNERDAREIRDKATLHALRGGSSVTALGTFAAGALPADGGNALHARKLVIGLAHGVVLRGARFDGCGILAFLAGALSTDVFLARVGALIVVHLVAVITLFARINLAISALRTALHEILRPLRRIIAGTLAEPLTGRAAHQLLVGTLPFETLVIRSERHGHDVTAGALAQGDRGVVQALLPHLRIGARIAIRLERPAARRFITDDEPAHARDADREIRATSARLSQKDLAAHADEPGRIRTHVGAYAVIGSGVGNAEHGIAARAIVPGTLRGVGTGRTDGLLVAG